MSLGGAECCSQQTHELRLIVAEQKVEFERELNSLQLQVRELETQLEASPALLQGVGHANTNDLDVNIYLDSGAARARFSAKIVRQIC